MPHQDLVIQAEEGYLCAEDMTPGTASVHLLGAKRGTEDQPIPQGIDGADAGG